MAGGTILTVSNSSSEEMYPGTVVGCDLGGFVLLLIIIYTQILVSRPAKQRVL